MHAHFPDVGSHLILNAGQRHGRRRRAVNATDAPAVNIRTVVARIPPLLLQLAKHKQRLLEAAGANGQRYRVAGLMGVVPH